MTTSDGVENFEPSDKALRFVLRLLIKHPSMNPDKISERLGMVPQMAHQAGSNRFTPKGNALPGLYPDSRWGWSKKIEGKRDCFSEVSALVDSLEKHKDFLSDISDEGGSTEIIVHLAGDANIGWTMPWQELSRMARLKIDLGIEVFPDFG
ncbi:MAG: DUF4279 domain-containing protein [Pseudolabrys sp.]|nr:DUF4279 domain-containing protein [Pseudolabrys sp.]